ncbi:MAG: type II secretion system GspH family protein [Clostridiales bacterium]|jgi:prepilin-type N-terminal cleavage/methylation domain-containing protein|nr:type II secretion system GspH family protein [Clostridiales bacterium]
MEQNRKNGDSGCRSGDSGIRVSGSGCRSEDSGFTVIELLIAFTILAIVAGSLFQIFYVSARNNTRAREYDVANNLAITAAELFKADPEKLGDDPMFAVEPGAVSGGTWRSGDGARFRKFYDENWRELEISLLTAARDTTVRDAAARGAAARDVTEQGAVAQGVTARDAAVWETVEPPDGARYVLEAELGEEPAEETADRNYLEGIANVELDASENFRLVVGDSGGRLEVLFNGVPQEIAQDAAGRVIPINVAFSPTGVMPKSLVVSNLTDIPVNVNMFGVPGQPGDEDHSEYISVRPSEGSLGVMFFDGQARAEKSVTRTFSATVREAAENGVELVHIDASKYVPG